VCNFNCPYCQYGWTQRSTFPASDAWPLPATIAAALSRRLRQAEARGERFDHLTISGRGEPTLHPRFGDVVRRLKGVRDRVVPGTRLAVLTNSSTVLLPSIRAALVELDERHMKLDAGDASTMNRLNGTRIPLSQIVAALAELPDIIIQAMFVHDPMNVMDNTSATAVERWLDAIERIRPSAVHIYTLDRPPACEFLRPVASDRLQQIAGQVRDAGITALVF
jgi:wyosine [tRNA(Phe)-imidazoG37] synthetase (radical SAM superfamily)